MGEALTIEARHEQGYPVVTVAGEIDIATATRLRERLFELAASGRPLVADLDQVRFIDSAGLAALVGAANRAAAHGGSLHVVCARPRIRQLFRLTGLDRRLPPAYPGRGPGRLDGGPGHAPLAGRRRQPRDRTRARAHPHPSTSSDTTGHHHGRDHFTEIEERSERLTDLPAEPSNSAGLSNARKQARYGRAVRGVNR